MSEAIQGPESLPENVAKRAGYKFLVKMWPDYREPLDVSGLDEEEAGRLSTSNIQMRELIRAEVTRLQKEIPEGEQRQLREDALAEQIRGWRQVMAGRPEKEIEEAVDRIRERWTSAYS